MARIDDQVRRRDSFTLVDVPKELLLVLANRRNAPRVRPDEAGLRVQLLHLGGFGGQVEVQDISTGALSMLLPSVVEGRLAETVQVQLELTLPDSHSALHLAAAIRNRRLCGSSILYGLQFDRQMPGFAQTQQRIAKYLATLGS